MLTPVVRQAGHHPSDPVLRGAQVSGEGGGWPGGRGETTVTILRDTVPVRHDPQVYSSRPCDQFHTYHQYDVTPVQHTRHEETNFPASDIRFRKKVFDI